VDGDEEDEQYSMYLEDGRTARCDLAGRTGLGDATGRFPAGRTQQYSKLSSNCLPVFDTVALILFVKEC
jgi:hypothetical protein